MDYEGGTASIRRRRQRRRATVTLTLVGLVMLGTFAYAAAYFQGWVAATPRSSKAAPACQVAAAAALTPGAVTLNVYNATNRDGLAKSAAKSLLTQGFKIGHVTNDPLGKPIAGVGEVRHGKLGAANAALVAKRLPGAKIVLDKRTDNSVDLVLGKRFSSLRAPARVVPAQATKPTTGPAPSC